HFMNPDNYLAQTMAFMTLSSVQLFHAFNIKSEKSVFHKSTFNNKYLILSFIVGLGLQLTILYVPFFASIFKLESLSISELFITLGLSFLIVIIMEIYKLTKKLKKIKI
ncbi:MAG: cation-translocating P-type ATPase C-terminal domain-containing protein, partial [Bacilli bacterium]